MKKNLILYLSATILLLAAISCKKDKDTATGDPKLRRIWQITSGTVYLDRGCTAPAGLALALLGVHTFEFRNNGKLYYKSPSTKDTSEYRVLANDTTLLLNAYQFGIRSSLTDTSYIRKLTDTELIFVSRFNPMRLDPIYNNHWVLQVFKKVE